MITCAPEETRAGGREFAQQLRPGDIVLLEGPLGSGKTTFVQGIAEGLGASASATSPSFVIMNEYLLGNGEQAASNRDNNPFSFQPSASSLLRHIDLYRLSDPAVDLERIGLPELLTDSTAITIIEWADRLPRNVLPLAARFFSISIAHGKNEIERVIRTKSGFAEF